MSPIDQQPGCWVSPGAPAQPIGLDADDEIQAVREQIKLQEMKLTAGFGPELAHRKLKALNVRLQWLVDRQPSTGQATDRTLASRSDGLR